MQEREAKRNKETRKQQRESALLHKDVGKMERKIEQYKNITHMRKMTAGEREKLQRLEEELKEVKEKQKEAGISPQEQARPTKAAGYDPMQASETHAFSIGGQYQTSSDESDGDSGAADAVRKSNLDDLGIKTIAVARTDGLDTGEQLPPMPAGTPPPLTSDDSGGVLWPPLPSGPSPMYLQANPHVAARSRQSRTGEKTGSQPHQSHGRGGQSNRRPHPYRARPDAHGSQPAGMSLNPDARTSLRAGAELQQRRPNSATVLAAEPQVRDLKKELTSFVPAAITRKSKQQGRQRVLEAIPAVPKMVVNAAPVFDADADEESASKKTPVQSSHANFSSTGSSGSSLLSAIQPHTGIRFSSSYSHTGHSGSKASSGSSEKLEHNGKDGGAENMGTSLDDEYQRFLKSMGGDLE
ncbi:hypothetical protein GGI07_003744 [Coemansia sp. Benny D115]|nr:hypothetical protein GGI07_003744 [Coemansia sp. Benny D115]